MDAGRQTRNAAYPSWAEYPSRWGAGYIYSLFGEDTSDQEAMFISHSLVLAGLKVERPTAVLPNRTLMV